MLQSSNKTKLCAKNGADQDSQPTWLPDRGKRPPSRQQLKDFGPKADSRCHAWAKSLFYHDSTSGDNLS